MNANEVIQRGGGIVRGTFRISERLARRLGSDAFGLVQRVRWGRPSPKPEMDDVTLARKVETEIFRSGRAPKTTVNVNVVDGVVWLRGEVKRPEQIRNLERKVRAIPEVRGVENLLHLPKTPAPTRADSPRRQQRTRSSTRRPTPRRSPASRVTDDKTTALVAEAEPSPIEHSERGRGRSPAPFGSTGPASPDTSGRIPEAGSEGLPEARSEGLPEAPQDDGGTA